MERRPDLTRVREFARANDVDPRTLIRRLEREGEPIYRDPRDHRAFLAPRRALIQALELVPARGARDELAHLAG